ncbi:type I DNA topoisomerase [Xanthobacter sp. DSM 14520]|uniref:type I DNA topoisomerase n=1 Tax=Xanthobacter autotrophicus (strain ATCC BAA-1158 / Py2) TaxID=78245 RepID=UPI00372C69ED
MRLLIVESPNKTKKIQQFLGAGWTVAASFGHIRDLPVDTVGVSAPDYRPSYIVPQKSKDHVQRLRQLADKADEVFLATDPDREGEAISWHIQQALKLKSPKRVTFTEITEKAVTAAVRAPRTIDDDLVRAQEARRVLDRLVGYEVSPILTRAVGTGASAGRVQSPAVRLVVDREEQIEKFRETKHFGARVVFDGGAWSAEWDTKPYLKPGEEYLLDKARASLAAACREFKVVSSEKKPALRQPQAPFTTSTLLQAASAKLGFKPEFTQSLAQKLFEGGHITYHRTDSQNLSDEAIAEIRALAAERKWPLPASPRRWGSKEGAQEAHEAIRPTHWENESAGDDAEQQRLYALIWLRAVACQLAPAEYFATTNVLEAENGPDRYRFTANGRVLKTPGYLVLTMKEGEEEEEEGEKRAEGSNGAVPILPAGSPKTADSGEVLAKATKPSTRFTQATLIKELEKEGIGRPSTYASILATIITKRQYVAEQKKYLVPTPLGRMVVSALKGKFSFVELDFTRDAEEQLDQIAQGKAQYQPVIAGMHARLHQEMGAMGIDPNAPFPPSEKQASYARRIAETLKLPLSDEALASAALLKAFINENIEKYNGAKEAAFAQRMAAEPASEKQLAVLEKAIAEGHVQPPEGWPSITKLAASQLLDQIMGSRSGSSDRKGTSSGGRKGTAAGKGRGGGRTGGRAAAPSSGSSSETRYASDKQMALLRTLVSDKKVPAPAGWPDKVLMADASTTLDKAFKSRKGSSK